MPNLRPRDRQSWSFCRCSHNSIDQSSRLARSCQILTRHASGQCPDQHVLVVLVTRQTLARLPLDDAGVVPRMSLPTHKVLKAATRQLDSELHLSFVHVRHGLHQHFRREHAMSPVGRDRIIWSERRAVGTGKVDGAAESVGNVAAFDCCQCFLDTIGATNAGKAVVLPAR